MQISNNQNNIQSDISDVTFSSSNLTLSTQEARKKGKKVKKGKISKSEKIKVKKQRKCGENERPDCNGVGGVGADGSDCFQRIQIFDHRRLQHSTQPNYKHRKMEMGQVKSKSNKYKCRFVILLILTGPWALAHFGVQGVPLGPEREGDLIFISHAHLRDYVLWWLILIADKVQETSKPYKPKRPKRIRHWI